ncbi:hypothetical protein PV341_29425 [Streptomyces sp. PA03-1a]|nr:hypothetical protein [Streptomyces sp. PA03-1a]
MRPEHGAYRTTDGRIRLGSGVYGLATEITDGPQQIADAVRTAHPCHKGVLGWRASPLEGAASNNEGET